MQEIHKIEPASEEWWLFRKPISETTITDNVLHWGTGGLNIDGCRVEAESNLKKYWQRKQSKSAEIGNYSMGNKLYAIDLESYTPTGRWPANVVHDGSDEVVGMFPDVKAGTAVRENSGGNTFGGNNKKPPMDNIGCNDSGSAARFFYSTKTNARHSKISQGKPMYTLHHGDCLEVLQTLPDNSVDSIVTDPPAGIAFMNMQWDKDKGGRDVWIAWMEKVAKECLRVMKPGGHALVWSLPRTSHWTGTAWENAGWEPRDKIYFLFGTGFPKSMNIGKQIDKMRGAERKITRLHIQSKQQRKLGTSLQGSKDASLSWQYNITAPTTEEAKQWDGWGTGLKPASEEWWLFRKPISETTITDNVLRWGTGGLNIDGCRVETQDSLARPFGNAGISAAQLGNIPRGTITGEELTGRWPANVVHDGSDEVVGMFPDTTSNSKPGMIRNVSSSFLSHANGVTVQAEYGDSGSAARFFYGAKASVRDRDEGLSKSDTTTRANIHPTVKSTELMRYLCRLVTPPHGIVLDPFTGSGSTGKGALKEGFQFIGIEMDEDYYIIARARLDYVLQQKGSS